MKGERNRIRALKAKIIYGEGTERRTAQRVLDQLEKDSDSQGYLPLLVQNEKSIIEQGRGLDMDDILQAYGDVLEDQQVNYNVLGLIVGLIFLIYGLAELLL